MNRKSVLAILAVLALAVGIVAPAFAAGPTVSTDNVLGVSAGQTIVVPVKIDTSGGKLLGWGFDLSWDPAVLSLTSWAEGPFIKDKAVALGGSADTFRIGGSINNTAGTLTGAAVAGIGFPAGEGATGAGVLANLTFLAKADGKATFSFSNTEMRNELNQLVSYDFNAGFVRVGPAPLLVVDSIVFTPASGAMSTSVAVTIRNNGAAMAAGDESVVTLAMNHATPVSQTFTVSGLTPGGTQVLTQAYSVDAGQTATRLTVTDSVYGINTSADYFASVSDIEQTDVDAKFDVFIQLATDGQIKFYPLALGNNQQYASMNVLSNAQAWTVGAAANPADWRMAEWTGSAFKPSGYKLNDVLKVFAYTGGLRGKVDAGVNGLLIPDGAIAGQSLDSGEAFSLTYAQFLHAGDAALTAPNTYHAILTYTAAVSF